jgi:GNAT superfamily N-acetyltransferase
VRAIRIHPVGEDDLGALLPLMREYCDFYGVDPPEKALLDMSRSLIADPQREGVQLLARDAAGEAVGFATVFWSWSTLRAARVGVMNDLYVAAPARGQGVAEALIEACREQARERGAATIGWQTAKDNLRAQAVYERVGARREEWVDYSLDAR